MLDVTRIVEQIQDELSEELRERVRTRLRAQSVDWLVEQLLTLVLPERGSAGAAPRRPAPTWAAGETEEDGDARTARLRELGLDEDSLSRYTERYRSLNRSVLEAGGYLVDPPPKGEELVPRSCRSPQGEALLREVRDVLYGLLFGGEEEGVLLGRTGRELLTLTVPRAKAHAVAFLLRAAAEVGAECACGDPEGIEGGVADTVLQIEYGEVTGGLVGGALSAALTLVNNLEVNEPVLHGRMESAES
ncbi:hypothetical protein [Streptosporangium carneum]|uniref:Uncharacterized protein n=1 Tax=Streptosporangium carneum TaxID=47481 RepID=A0A9W6I3F4_9ACTN|nr:hypothetical protein [Streptosporangium carneum]GLK10716.1 hypothetical protein GCM10017600_41220 [Streptosporangium carneum]